MHLITCTHIANRWVSKVSFTPSFRWWRYIEPHFPSYAKTSRFYAIFLSIQLFLTLQYIISCKEQSNRKTLRWNSIEYNFILSVTRLHEGWTPPILNVMKINLEFIEGSDKMYISRGVIRLVRLEPRIAHALAFMQECTCKNACQVVWVGAHKRRKADDIERGTPRVVCQGP